MPDSPVFAISVLYVEDEPGTRQELARFLGRRVSQLLTAADGLEGLSLYQAHRPELVVTDIRMPHLDGIAMAQAIKRLDWGAKIIVTTAHSDTANLLAAIDAGVDGFVLKPVETDRLLAVLGKCAEAVEIRRQARALQEERETLLVELRAALAKVKLLSGLLPICASCKRIRDDQGYWQQIECYIRDHSEADFSHGICPDCVRKLYPDLFPDNG
ncbi:MAG: response regulator [Thermodesulfobacteriota bacterium]